MVINIQKSLKLMIPHLLQARDEKLSESDTVKRVERVCERVLGYDSMSDMSQEVRMKSKILDLVLKIDGEVRIIVEVKAADQQLAERHIDQAQNYASANSIQWVLLTNGIVWKLYHLSFNEKVKYGLAFSVDLTEDEKFRESCLTLAALHKESVSKGGLDKLWGQSAALSPKSIALALRQEEVLAAIRREIRKKQGRLVDSEHLLRAIFGLFSAENKDLIGPPRPLRRKQKKRPVVDVVPIDATPSVPSKETEQGQIT